MKEYCSVRDSAFSSLEELHDLETGSLHQNVNLVLANFPYGTHSFRGQASSACDVFCKTSIEDAVRFMSDVVVSRAHGTISFSDLMFFHWNMSVFRQTEMVEDVKADP